jgi:hypothetical protein
MATIEQQARAKFEADLATRKAEARRLFESGLTEAKDKSTFEANLAEQERQARATFETQVAERKGAYKSSLEAGIREAKRQAVIKQKVQLAPRLVRTYRETQLGTFEEMVGAEKEAYAGEIETWKGGEIEKNIQAVASWEQEQKGLLEENLVAWESEAKAGFESGLSAWKEGEVARMEGQIGEWRKTWQPKGLAERMMEIKVPSLDLSGKLAEALGVKPMMLDPYGRIGIKPYKPEVTPLALPAGIVASVESFAYGIGQIAGVPTPRIPPTVSGGLISSAILSIQKGELTAAQELERVRMEPAYGAGTIIGDVFVALGIGKAAKVGAKAVKGAAGFIYEESGLKYSHWLYETKETLGRISEELQIKTVPQAIRESHTVYEISEALSSLKHKIMPTKFMRVPAEGIIGLPTLEEEVSLKGVSAFKEGARMSKALETATAIGVTPLEYGKAMYPKAFTAMELMGWAEAPKTAALGLTVPSLAETAAKVVAKTPLAEALAETMWIAPSATEKWAARAGVIPSLEDVIVQPPKELAEQMIKGGRYFDIDVQKILGFAKAPYKVAAAGKFFFEKERLPTMKDLLKAEKGEATLAEMLAVPSKVVEVALPHLALLPERMPSAQALGAALTLGLKGRVKPEVKPLARVKPLAEEILKSEVEVTPVQKVKVKQSPLMKEIISATQAVTVIPKTALKFAPPSVPLIPKRRREEALFMARRLTKKERKLQKKMAGYLYPVLPERELPAYMKIGLGKAKKLKSATSFILGKGKKNVLHKTRHKRK